MKLGGRNIDFLGTLSGKVAYGCLLPFLCFAFGQRVVAGEQLVQFPEACFIHNGQGGGVIDVTQPPYNADNTGKEDCTKILIRALDDITARDRDLMRQTMAVLEAHAGRPASADSIPFAIRQKMIREDQRAIVGFERCAGIFPYTNPPSRILYFPKGVYLVSDTICYSHPDLVNRPGKEMNRMIHIQGESEAETIIRLKPHAPGFEEGSGKPVVSFTNGNPSNISMQNTLEDLTIEVGKGNAGAVGVEFYCNNTGAVRNVTIRSLDSDGLGFAGLAIRTDNSSCGLIQHVRVEGFDYGLLFDQPRLYTVVEHITLRHQRKAGLYLKDHNLAARGIQSDNRVPGVMMRGNNRPLPWSILPSMEEARKFRALIFWEDFFSRGTSIWKAMALPSTVRAFPGSAIPVLNPTLRTPVRS